MLTYETYCETCNQTDFRIRDWYNLRLSQEVGVFPIAVLFLVLFPPSFTETGPEPQFLAPRSHNLYLSCLHVHSHVNEIVADHIDD